MDARRRKLIDELVDAVLEVPGERREEFLSEKCGDDEELKNEIRSRLAVRKETTEFMEHSAMDLMAKDIAHNQTTVADSTILGRQLNNYRIERRLGAGGMGEVYLAHDEKLNRKVALKILPGESLTDAEKIKRFEREAKMISALNHPYIVTIYDVGQVDDVNYIATEYVEGMTVRDLINHGANLKQTLSIVAAACEALAAAHKAGIVHRDIKPENIMIRPDGIVKVLDFGLARLTEQTKFQQNLSDLTKNGMIMGTPDYMSPQQIGDNQADHRTDLWSLGVVFYEMLTGKNPFKGESRQQTFYKILSEEPTAVSELNNNLSPKLDAILGKALEKNPELSYQSALDICADVKRLQREIDSAVSAGNSVSSQSRPVSKAGQRNYFVYVIGVLFLVLLAWGVWFFVLNQVPLTKTDDWSKAKRVQLTDRVGTEYFPSLSPDGKSFVYASDENGNFDIFTQRVGGKTPQNLTLNSTGDDTQPAFSPNGKQIVFRSERQPAGIYVMEASGENLHRVADFGYHPSWSPDGTQIVVSTFGLDAPNVRIGHDNGLWIIDAETGARRELLKGNATYPTWSPNGKRIAYWLYPESLSRRDIATVPVDGGAPVVITSNFGTSNWNPVWAPDGKFLYFVSDGGGDVNLWRVSIDESTGDVLSEPEPINTPSSYSRHLNFSRDGKRMVYVQTDDQSNIQGIKFDSKAEKTIGERFWITRGDRIIVRAELSPDGKRFVMRRTRRTQDDIVVVDRDGSNWHDVTNDLPFDRYPRWSPDSQQIAFVSDRNVGMEIWICNADGSGLKQITFRYAPTFSSSFPIWSPDGKSLIFTNNSQSYQVDLTKSWEEQAPPRVLPPEIGTPFAAWDWSPDGKKLVGNLPRNEFAIAVYSFETKQLERIVENLEKTGPLPSWLPDSRRIVFATEGKIFITDTITKQKKEILSHQPETISSAFVSRDGQLLYYTAHSSESNIWLLDISKGSP